MKTPDKIKKGLRIHSTMHNGCVGCPYKEIGNRCSDVLFKDLRDYTRQLEAQNAELLQKVQQLEHERDAAVKDLQAISVLTFTACLACKHSRGNGKNCPRSVETVRCFEWRGVCEQNEGADHA